MKDFSTERGLSSHFQHKKLCKTIHYDISFHTKEHSRVPHVYVPLEVNDSRKDKTYESSFKTRGLNDASLDEIKLSGNNNHLFLEENMTDNFTENLQGDEIHLEENIAKADMNNIISDNKCNSFSFHNNNRIENSLLKIIMEIGAPNYAFKKIMEWAKDAYNTGYQFNPKSTTYKSQIKTIEKHSNMSCLRPIIKQVILPPDNLMLDVTCFDFSSMLASLLNDTSINQLPNLVINTDDPFGKYISPTGKLAEINSGYWYHQAYINLVKDKSKDFLLSIIFAMDKTTISNAAHLHVFVIMFTTSLFKRNIRNQAHAWRPLGYVPIDRNYYSGPQWDALKSNVKSFRLNMMFDMVLQSFRAAQVEGALKIPLKLGNLTKDVNLKVPLAFIIGDIQGGDGICGHSAYYNTKARRICRMCNATPEVYDTKEVDNCQPLVMEEIKQMNINRETKQLYDLQQYNTWQAFFDIDYGRLPGGVFTAACPPEALHSLENGLIHHCLIQLFDKENKMLLPLSQRKIDMIIQKWALYPRQKHMKAYNAEFPRLIFQDGVTSITNLSAGTKVGILFSIVIAALTKDGRKVFLVDALFSTKNYLNMIEAFELLLSYWAWLKKDELWDVHDSESLQSAKLSIFKTINQIKHLFPRSKGNSWKIPKMHEQLHVAYYIWLFGCHKNIHTGPQEHNHIAITKKPSQRMQKRRKDFDWQLGNCLNDQYTIEFTKNQIQNHQANISNDNVDINFHKKNVPKLTDMATKFEVTMKLNEQSNNVDVLYKWFTALKHSHKISHSLLELITSHFFVKENIENKINGIKVVGLTEYTTKGVTYRAHPCYKNGLAWFDWVLIVWDIPTRTNLSESKNDDCPDYVLLPNHDNENEHNPKSALLIPAKLICIIKDDSNNIYAIVHSCLQFCKKVSVLTYCWQMENEDAKIIRESQAQYIDEIISSQMNPIYHKVCIESIQKHCLIVPYAQHSPFVMEIIDPNHWAKCFSTV